MAKSAAATKKAPTKSEIFGTIAENTGLTRKQVGQVFDELGDLIKKNLSPRGPQQFAIPGLCKMTVKKKPATKAHTRPDPFNPGQMMQVKAKPASKQVKIRPLKNLKDMV